MPESLFAHVGELLRRVIARHRQVISGWTQVLSNGQHVRSHRCQVAIHLQQLVHFFSQADHDTGLGGHARVDDLGILQQPQRALVTGARSHHAIEPRDRFGVVVQHLGLGLDHDADSFFLALKVRDKDFHLAAGRLAANLLDHHRKGACASKNVVVTIHAGDDRMFELKSWRPLPPPGGVRRSRWGPGGPLGTAQKPQRRVQVLPSIMKVAVRWFQHSPILGQWADSHTVCRFSDRARVFSS